MTVSELQKLYCQTSNKKISPEDFFILLAHVTKKEKIFLLAHPEYSFDRKTAAFVEKLLERRLGHEPVAYITGYKEFYGFDFAVTRDTLIPRPETELLVELAIESINCQQKTVNKKQKAVVIDIGTGSGNIIISLAKATRKLYPESRIKYYAVDISKQALAIAKKNAKKHKVASLIQFFSGDLLNPLEKEFTSSDTIIITANLPYLSKTLYKNTAPDVQNFEPRSALVSDTAGLSHYSRLLKQIKKVNVRKPMVLFLEISPEQTSKLVKIITTPFPNARIHIHKDLAQKNRCIKAFL